MGMRINQYIALATGMSRRQADTLVQQGRVEVNGKAAVLGMEIHPGTQVLINGQTVSPPADVMTILLNKPVGYVCSRDGQGSKTIYDLLPRDLHHLKPIGRLDKDSSGLLLLTNDGTLAHELTHPRFEKQKVYEIELAKDLDDSDKTAIGQGVELNDGLSRLKLEGSGQKWTVTMSEGRNRQIRRTFEVVGNKVTCLERKQFGQYTLEDLDSGKYKVLT